MAAIAGKIASSAKKVTPAEIAVMRSSDMRRYSARSSVFAVSRSAGGAAVSWAGSVTCLCLPTPSASNRAAKPAEMSLGVQFAARRSSKRSVVIGGRTGRPSIFGAVGLPRARTLLRAGRFAGQLVGLVLRRFHRGLIGALRDALHLLIAVADEIARFVLQPVGLLAQKLAFRPCQRQKRAERHAQRKADPGHQQRLLAGELAYARAGPVGSVACCTSCPSCHCCCPFHEGRRGLSDRSCRTADRLSRFVQRRLRQTGCCLLRAAGEITGRLAALPQSPADESLLSGTARVFFREDVIHVGRTAVRHLPRAVAVRILSCRHFFSCLLMGVECRSPG